MKNYKISLLCTLVLLVYIPLVRAEWKHDYWDLFEIRFKGEIDLFETISVASVLQARPRSRAHWDAYFKDTSVVAVGLIRTRRKIGEGDDPKIDISPSIDWIWTKELITSRFSVRSQSFVTIPKSSLKTRSVPLFAGKGSVRFGKHKYQEAFSLMGEAEESFSLTGSTLIGYQAICILDGE